MVWEMDLWRRQELVYTSSMRGFSFSSRAPLLEQCAVALLDISLRAHHPTRARDLIAELDNRELRLASAMVVVVVRDGVHDILPVVVLLYD